MAATGNLYQLAPSHNSPISRHGVLTAHGYGVQIKVDRAHLLVEDGVGLDRRVVRLPRVGHKLKRLVVITHDGFVSLAALRWLADQDVALSILERDGDVLCVTGPVRPSDARLRRSQAMAVQSGLALEIARELIRRKLDGQERVARDKLLASGTADAIARFKAELPSAETIPSVRLIESQAALAYWSAWRTLPINFPKNDLRQGIPEHWLSFGARISPLTGSTRLAANPPNAILNYLYAVLESEARLAAAALGLDPGLGVLHVDAPNRDSLALDLLEPVRPQVDAYLLGWVTKEFLRRSWFFEQRDGNCRLMSSLCVRLSETALTWARAVAPIAEWVVQALWSQTKKGSWEPSPATRLTQRRKREAKGSHGFAATPSPRPQHVCGGCGKQIDAESTNCAVCAVAVSRENLIERAKLGRVVAQRPEAQARRSATKRRHDAAMGKWAPSSQPAWLTDEAYAQKIQPLLANITVPAISSALGVSEPYAADIRAGRRRPHPRHWQALAKMTGVALPS